MMAKARKRRPGGGRKPQGTLRGNAKTFATRLTPETREADDDAARRSRIFVDRLESALEVGDIQQPIASGATAMVPIASDESQ